MKIYEVNAVIFNDKSLKTLCISPFFSTKEKAEKWCKDCNINLTRPKYSRSNYYRIDESECY